MFLGYSFNTQAQILHKEGELVDAQAKIKAFNALPSYVVFCSQSNFDLGDFNELKPILQPFFSVEFFKLFVWARCYLPNRTTEPDGYHWDFRYGIDMVDSQSSKNKIKNLKIFPATLLSGNRASVKTIYNFYKAEDKPLITTYTLIYEEGVWKIDDIALKGFVLNKGTAEEEAVLPASKSLKADLKAAYEEAEIKYKQDQANKSKIK